ncbi:YppE family protein [Cytobacillus suaedae]|nr:YppE family protein [Cytobacillus suaedae]
MNNKDLVALTNHLLEKAEESIQRLVSIKGREDYEPDFFGEVKPYADEVHVTLDQWRELTLTWIQKEKPKYLYKLQIDTAIENIELLIVQSFYKDTREKRAKEMYQSIVYTLKSILDQIHQKNGA